MSENNEWVSTLINQLAEIRSQLETSHTDYEYDWQLPQPPPQHQQHQQQHQVSVSATFYELLFVRKCFGAAFLYLQFGFLFLFFCKRISVQKLLVKCW
jgi:hypothetical protein